MIVSTLHIHFYIFTILIHKRILGNGTRNTVSFDCTTKAIQRDVTLCVSFVEFFFRFFCLASNYISRLLDVIRLTRGL